MRNLKKFPGDNSGNVAVLFAFAVVPLLCAVGAGVDYANASAREAQLDGIADSAALSALTPTMLNLPPATQAAAMKAQAEAFFDAQSGAVPGVGTITRSAVVTSVGTTWTVNMQYSTNSANAFGKLLLLSNIAIGGTSQAKAASAPNTDFYLLVDTSPSMEVAATPAGMVTLVGNTQHQVDVGNGQTGCAFGCHYTNTWVGSSASATPDRYLANYSTVTGYSPVTSVTDKATGNLYAVASNGHMISSTSYDTTKKILVPTDATGNPLIASGFTQTITVSQVNGSNVTPFTKTFAIDVPIDNYALSRSLNDPVSGKPPLLLRIDLVNDAVTTLFQTAPGKAAANHAVYNGAVYTFDQGLHTALALTPVATAVAPTMAPLIYCTNNNQQCGVNDKDEATTLDDALRQMYAIMPTPGSGAKTPLAVPREVLLIVTDGLNDYNNGGRKYDPIGTGTTTPASTSGSWCTDIKNKMDTNGNPGIKVAVLYLTYNSMWPQSVAYGSYGNGKGSDWYSTQVSPNPNPPATDPEQAKITAAALACASPGLFTEVQAGGDVTAALLALFDKATQQAYLSL